MQRVRNWDVHLLQWHEERRGEPFVWGETDCAHLALEALGVMYEDPPISREDLGLSYDTQHGALKSAKNHDIPEVLRKAGATTHELAFAQNGDVVFHPDFEQNDHFALAVVVNHGVLVAHQEEGVIRHPLTDVNPDAQLFRFPNG